MLPPGLITIDTCRILYLLLVVTSFIIVGIDFSVLSSHKDAAWIGLMSCLVIKGISSQRWIFLVRCILLVGIMY